MSTYWHELDVTEESNDRVVSYVLAMIVDWPADEQAEFMGSGSQAHHAVRS